MQGYMMSLGTDIWSIHNNYIGGEKLCCPSRPGITNPVGPKSDLRQGDALREGFLGCQASDAFCKTALIRFNSTLLTTPRCVQLSSSISKFRTEPCSLRLPRCCLRSAQNQSSVDMMVKNGDPDLYKPNKVPKHSLDRLWCSTVFHNVSSQVSFHFLSCTKAPKIQESVFAA